MSCAKRVTIDFPENLYRIIKAFTAFNDSTVKEFVLSAVSKELTNNNIKLPNELTFKTFKDTDVGKNIKSYGSFNDLLEEINPSKK